MPAPALVAVLLALLVGNVLMVVALLGRRRATMTAADEAAPLAGEPVDLAIELAGDPDGRPASGSGIRLETYDRVVRTVSYAFLLVTAIVVMAGGMWPDSAPAIYLLLLVAVAVVFALHELAPRTLDVASLFLLEGAAAVTFFTLLVVLTGGVESPFFFGYFLIVAAGALVTGGGASLVLAAAITAAYLGALLVTRGGQPYATDQVIIVAINVMALWLLSYLASVVAGEQRRTRDAALRLSLHDPLTRLYNRTFLFAVIEREIARASRTSRRFSLLMLDLDGLKPINDRFGHYFGDRMLQAVAEAIRQHIRLIDTAARYGGDEFVVLLPETDTEGAAVVAEKLRRSVAAIRLNAGMDLLSSTASIGVVAFPDDGRTADALTNRADQVMYGAKRAGRNRVSVEGVGPAPTEVEPPPSGIALRDPGRAMEDARTARRPSPPSGQAIVRGARTVPRRSMGSTRRLERARAAVEPRPSMFSDRYPTLSPSLAARPTTWSWDSPGPRSPSAQGSTTMTGDIPLHGSRTPTTPGPIAPTGASPLATTKTPTTRARRFFMELPEDQSFDRTMDHFLGEDPPPIGAAEPDGPRA